MSARLGGSMLAALIAAGAIGPNTGARAARGPRRFGKRRTNTYRKRGPLNRAQEQERRRRQIAAGVLRAENRGVLR